MLYDPVLDMEREVDVVIRGRVNEIDVLISFEVVDYSRKADVQWVEGKLKKHEHLATDKLMLVSWKGFTEGAKRLAASRPDIVLMAPKPVPAGHPRSLMLYADTIKFTLDRATVDLTTPSGEARRVTGFTMDTRIYDGDGKEVASLGAYLVAMFAKNEVPRELLVEAHHRDDREEIRAFEVGMTPRQENPLFVHHTETDEHHAVVSIVVTGPFAWSQSPVDLRVVSFNDVVFGHGKLTLNGHEGQMVLTIQDNQPSGRGAIHFFDSPIHQDAEVPYS